MAIEKDTNQVFRKKYFVPADSIISAHTVTRSRPRSTSGGVIASSRVVMAPQPVALRQELGDDKKTGDIQVEVVKNGTEIKGIKIKCPCGRHAELDVAYST